MYKYQQHYEYLIVSNNGCPVYDSIYSCNIDYYNIIDLDTNCETFVQFHNSYHISLKQVVSALEDFDNDTLSSPLEDFDIKKKIYAFSLILIREKKIDLIKLREIGTYSEEERVECLKFIRNHKIRDKVSRMCQSLVSDNNFFLSVFKKSLPTIGKPYAEDEMKANLYFKKK